MAKQRVVGGARKIHRETQKRRKRKGKLGEKTKDTPDKERTPTCAQTNKEGGQVSLKKHQGGGHREECWRTKWGKDASKWGEEKKV